MFKSDHYPFLKDYVFEEWFNKYANDLHLHQELCFKSNWVEVDIQDTRASICCHSCGTFCKILFSKIVCCFEKKIQCNWVKNVFLISLISAHWVLKSEILLNPWTPGAAARNERLYFIRTPKFFFPAWMRGSTEARHFFFTAETSNSFT